MDKEKFLTELKEKLSNLSAEERDSIIADYEKKFDAAKMQSEKSVIDEIGSMDKIAEDVLKSKNNSVVVNNVQEDKTENKDEYKRVENNNSLNFVSIILIAMFIIILIPIMIPLFFAIFGILIGFFFAGIGLTIAGIAVGGVGLVGLFIQPASGLLMMGIGCILFALGILFTICSIYISAICIPVLIRAIVKICRVPFQRGE